MTTVVAVVDDDPRIRELFASELEELGAEVMSYRDGSALLADDRLNQVKLVLLDWLMPGLDGESTLRALKNQAFRAPVVVVTALSDLRARETAQREGAEATLLKTEVIDQLPQLLNRA